jgi:hypothetical protein
MHIHMYIRTFKHYIKDIYNIALHIQTNHQILTMYIHNDFKFNAYMYKHKDINRPYIY